ncbi:hypothetical protein OH77DRAFT_493453 [Trametes cingulata]|nr:hypothetical protein OH77DRAFT_493453 [Trametes cingulata]
MRTARYCSLPSALPSVFCDTADAAIVVDVQKSWGSLAEGETAARMDPGILCCSTYVSLLCDCFRKPILRYTKCGTSREPRTLCFSNLSSCSCHHPSGVSACLFIRQAMYHACAHDIDSRPATTILRLRTSQ